MGDNRILSSPVAAEAMAMVLSVPILIGIIRIILQIDPTFHN